jgi:hypothetical protein
MDNPAQGVQTGKPLNSIYKEKVLAEIEQSEAPTEKQQPDKTTDGRPYKGAVVSTSHDNYTERLPVLTLTKKRR